MDGTEKSCTFCSCHEVAEYTTTLSDTQIGLCAHHAALLGGPRTLRLRPINATQTPRPVVLDHGRLLASARSLPDARVA